MLSLDKWKIHMILIFWGGVVFYSDVNENEKFTKENESIYLSWFYQEGWNLFLLFFNEGSFGIWQPVSQDYIQVDSAAASQACYTQILLQNP